MVDSSVKPRESIINVVKVLVSSVSLKLIVGILLTNGTTALVGSGVLAAMGIDLGPSLLLLGATTILSTAATWAVSQLLLASPILTLAETVRVASVTNDYSVRANKRSEDEIGTMLDKVNELLGLMEGRDKQIRGKGERLEADVIARTRELVESNKRLEAASAQAVAANNAKSQFIANMSHEVRTPMNGVLSMTELLFNTDLTLQQPGFTRTILESAEDLLSIINNVLDFSRVEAGKLEKIDNHPFSPRECVGRVTDLLEARAQLAGLTLSDETSDDVPRALLGDGKRVRQVLTNLIGNAIKFTEHGTVVVRTTLAEKVDEVATIRFEVVDTGIGVPGHLHEHIFEGFTQADTSTTRQFGGTGLGLTISKHLVELMGGEVGLISRPSVGSNFWFTIKGALQQAPTADRDLGEVHALIVASTSASRDNLRHHLTTCGGVGFPVANLEDALATLRTQAFDVVLIDTQAVDGLALTREIRALEATRSLPVVLVVGVERPERELREAGVDGSIVKPVEQGELFACVASVTGRLDLTVSDENQTFGSDDWGRRRHGRPQALRLEKTVEGARILLAEDNPVNRKVARKMIEALKCHVDVVMNGVQAVDAVQRQYYDLVFLDCQMPKLDGYEAARQIRHLEQQGQVAEGEADHPGHLPIVALTAHTAATDRARSLESGMDDFVTKPFTLQTLQDVVGKWAGDRVGRTEPLPSPANADSITTTDEPLINNATFEGSSSSTGLTTDVFSPKSWTASSTKLQTGSQIFGPLSVGRPPTRSPDSPMR